MRKRRTKNYNTEMCYFLCPKRPRKNYVLTFSDGRYGRQEKTEVAELSSVVTVVVPDL